MSVQSQPTNQASIELPECPKSGLQEVLHEYRNLFQTVPGVTGAAYHCIPIMGNPVKVPPPRIPTIEKKWKSKSRQCWIRASLKRAASHAWYQLCLYHRNQAKYECSWITASPYSPFQLRWNMIAFRTALCAIVFRDGNSGSSAVWLE